MGALTQVALIAASCCAGPIRSLVVVVVVACCCCILYRLALMLALTFAPCTLTFAPCAYGVSLLSTGATIPLAQRVVVTSCNLHWWCFILQPLVQIVHLHTWWFTLCNLRWWCFFIHPLAQILHLHSGNLYIYIYIYIPHTTTTTQCKLQNMLMCNVSTLVNAWSVKEKHHQHKLQVVPTASASEVFALIDGRKNTTSANCRGSRPSWELVGVGCSNQMQLAQGQLLDRVCALGSEPTPSCL